VRPLDRLGRGLQIPFLQGVVLYVIFLAASLVGRLWAPAFPLLAGAVAVTFYSVAGPLALVFVPKFWRALFTTAVTWLLLLASVSTTCEWLMGRLRDDAMVFLGAFMVFPVALAFAGILRFARRRRHPAPPLPERPSPAAPARG
jgi:hypothetical protein